MLWASSNRVDTGSGRYVRLIQTYFSCTDIFGREFYDSSSGITKLVFADESQQNGEDES
jgi:hypothetical protein